MKMNVMATHNDNGTKKREDMVPQHEWVTNIDINERLMCARIEPNI